MWKGIIIAIVVTTIALMVVGSASDAPTSVEVPLGKGNSIEIRGVISHGGRATITSITVNGATVTPSPR